MKQTGIALAIIAAAGNLLIAFMIYRLVHIAQSALPTPLDANPPTTVFFIRAWWWPLIISLLLILTTALPQLRRRPEHLTILIAILLGVEAVILFLELGAFVVPLSHVPTPEMINHAVIY